MFLKYELCDLILDSRHARQLLTLRRKFLCRMSRELREVLISSLGHYLAVIRNDSSAVNRRLQSPPAICDRLLLFPSFLSILALTVHGCREASASNAGSHQTDARSLTPDTQNPTAGQKPRRYDMSRVRS